MKKIIILLSGCFYLSIVNASNFLPAKVVFNNSDTLSGYVEYPLESNSRSIQFKSAPGANQLKYPSDSLLKIIYESENGFVTYERRMREGFPLKDKVYGPEWLQIINSGHVTLYSEISRIGYATYKIWLCRKENKETATVLSAVTTGMIMTMNPNSMFRKTALDYFSDFPDIKKHLKEKKYNWENIEELVSDYNDWIDKEYYKEEQPSAI